MTKDELIRVLSQVIASAESARGILLIHRAKDGPINQELVFREIDDAWANLTELHWRLDEGEKVED